MKKIAIGLAILFFLIPSITLAASTATVKNEVSIPCYNSGFTFGLAGYSKPLPPASDLNTFFTDNANSEMNKNQNIEPDYR